MTRQQRKRIVLFGTEPEDYGYEWDNDLGCYARDGDRWEYEREFEMEWAYDNLKNNLPSNTNPVALEGDRSHHDELFGDVWDAARAAIEWEGGLESAEIDGGDLYVNGHLVRELTDKGKRWADANPSQLGRDATHCLETEGYTRAVGSGAKRVAKASRSIKAPSKAVSARRRAAKANKPATKRSGTKKKARI